MAAPLACRFRQSCLGAGNESVEKPRDLLSLSSSREDPPRSGVGMIGSPCPPTKGESSSQAKLFDNDRHYWYTCTSKSGLMTPPVPRGSRELTPVVGGQGEPIEANGRANMH